MKGKIKWSFLLVCMLSLVMVLPAGATVILNTNSLVYEFDYQFSTDPAFGTASPVGSTPWLTATFSQIDVYTVGLTIDTAGLTGTEFVSEFYFNVDDNLTGTLTFSPYGPSHIPNSYSADGSHGYDIMISYPTSGDRFGLNETDSYQITLLQGGPLGGTPLPLDFLEFYELSSGLIGHGPFYAAAHIQGIGVDDDSGWIAPNTPIPEPATMFLLGSGLVGLAGFRRKFKK